MRFRLSVLAALAATVMANQASAEPVRVAPTLDGSKSCAKPVYPAIARRMGEQGTVVLRFLVGSDGVPIRSEVMSSSGSERLDKAAQDALSLCHFKPSTIDGQPAPEPGWAQLRYTWKLEAPQTVVPPQAWEPKCSEKPKSADFAAQLAEIPPAAKIGGNVRFVVPPASIPILSACRGVYLRTQAEALRLAGLFDHVELDETGITGVRPRPKSEDYTLWVENGTVAGAYRGGPRVVVGDGRRGLSDWARLVPEQAKMARDLQDAQNSSVATTLIGLQPFFAFHGKEYLSTADLEDGVYADAAVEGRNVPSGPAIGRGARVILAPEALLIGWAEARSAKAPPADLPRVAMNQLGWSVTAYALAKGWAPAVQSAGLFKTIEVEEGNFPNPPLSGYDAVIWNDPAAPFRWKVRDKSGAVHDLPGADTAQDWLAAVRAALTGTQAK